MVNCNAGIRSTMPARIFYDAGFENESDFPGGMGQGIKTFVEQD